MFPEVGARLVHLRRPPTGTWNRRRRASTSVAAFAPAASILPSRRHHPPSHASMCGIFFSLCRGNPAAPNTGIADLLKNRGPDNYGTWQVGLDAEGSHGSTDPVHATFVSTVLSLRGAAITQQPLVDEASGSVLCWNGEAWEYAGQPVSGSDSHLIFQALLAACKADTEQERQSYQKRVVKVLFSISGPYAFVFYDARNRYLYYGRDCLGRRSLLRRETANHDLILSSVCDNSSGEGWSEIEADGIHVVDFLNVSKTGPFFTTHVPHCHQCTHIDQLHFVGKSLLFQRILSEPGCTFSCYQYHDTNTRIRRLPNLGNRHPAGSCTS